MEKRFILLGMLLVIGLLPLSNSNAQTTGQYTLQQCIDYALNNFVDVKNAELDVQVANAKVGEVRGAGLPQLNGSAGITDNPELQRMFMTGANASTFIQGMTFEPNKVYAFPNFFQLRSMGDANLSLNQLLFDGSYFVGLKASQVYKELANKSLVHSKIQVVENVTKAFYMVLINEEQLELINSHVARLDSTYNNVKALHNEGFTESIDVNRIEVARNNLLAERTKFLQLKDVTKLLLKYQMGISLNDSISIQGSIRDLQIETLNGNEQVNPENRIEYKLMKTQNELMLLDVKRNRAAFAPSLVGFAKGGYMRMDQTVDKLPQGDWYRYFMWGINLNVPILSGGSRLYKLKQANYEYQKSENNLQQFRQSADLQVKQAQISLDNELKTLEIHKRNLDLATEVVRVSRIKYNNGSGSNLEVTEAENGFKEAQTNYFNAVYNVLLAKIEYQKSTGTLYTE